MDTQKKVDLFVKKYNFKPSAEMTCPKWEHCSCNKCPLHKDFAKLQVDISDKERKCLCPKSIRKEIGVYFKLKNIGLRVRELEGLKLSIQIQKQSSFTQENNLKTPRNNTSKLNSNPSNSDKSIHSPLLSPAGVLNTCPKPSKEYFHNLGQGSNSTIKKAVAVEEVVANDTSAKSNNLNKQEEIKK